MRVLKPAIATLAMLSLGYVCVAPAASPVATKSHQTEIRAATSLHLVLKSGRDRFTDTGRPGFSFGDHLVYRDEVWQGGERVGSHGGTCLVLSVVKHGIGLNCVTTLRLRHGQLSIQGIARSPLPEGSAVFTFAVTGGTKTYEGATGQATLTDHGNRQTFVVHLQ